MYGLSIRLSVLFYEPQNSGGGGWGKAKPHQPTFNDGSDESPCIIASIHNLDTGASVFFTVTAALLAEIATYFIQTRKAFEF